jgi:hypothetical protein
MLLILSLIIPDYFHSLPSKVLTHIFKATNHTSQGIAMESEIVGHVIRNQGWL